MGWRTENPRKPRNPQSEKRGQLGLEKRTETYSMFDRVCLVGATVGTKEDLRCTK